MGKNASRFHKFWKRTFVFLFIFLFFISTEGCQVSGQSAPVNGAAGIGDDYYPWLGNGGYDVQNYDIILDVDPPTNYVNATVNISAIATENLATFNLDFQGLTVDSVTVNDRAATFVQKNPELTITPSAPLDAQRLFNVSVNYHGNPKPIQSAANSLPVGWQHSDDGAINVISEPDGASTWYPNNNHPLDKATYHFEITVPKPWIVAATGSLKQTKDVGEKTTYIWEMNKPMASYLVSVDIDKYIISTSQGPNGVLIRNYFPPDYPESSKRVFDALPEMIKYLNSLYGNYPFDEYGVVIADKGIPVCMGIGQALETQTLSIYCPDPGWADEKIIIHELAHQWFGDDVSLKSWKDVWLKEGMAFYAQWLWDYRDDDLKSLTKMIRMKSSAYDPHVPISQPPANDLYRPEVYKIGGVVFHALRLKVGETAFFQILRTYLTRYSYGNASPNDFIAIAEEVSGQKLKGLFDTWLNTATVPSLAP